MPEDKKDGGKNSKDGPKDSKPAQEPNSVKGAGSTIILQQTVSPNEDKIEKMVRILSNMKPHVGIDSVRGTLERAIQYINEGDYRKAGREIYMIDSDFYQGFLISQRPKKDKNGKEKGKYTLSHPILWYANRKLMAADRAYQKAKKVYDEWKAQAAKSDGLEKATEPEPVKDTIEPKVFEMTAEYASEVLMPQTKGLGEFSHYLFYLRGPETSMLRGFNGANEVIAFARESPVPKGEDGYVIIYKDGKASMKSLERLIERGE